MQSDATDTDDLVRHLYPLDYERREPVRVHTKTTFKQYGVSPPPIFGRSLAELAGWHSLVYPNAPAPLFVVDAIEFLYRSGGVLHPNVFALSGADNGVIRARVTANMGRPVQFDVSPVGSSVPYSSSTSSCIDEHGEAPDDDAGDGHHTFGGGGGHGSGGDDAHRGLPSGVSYGSLSLPASARRGASSRCNWIAPGDAPPTLLVPPSEDGVCIAGGLLRQWLKELPAPVISFPCYRALHRCFAHHSSETACRIAVRVAITLHTLLTPFACSTLRELLVLFQTIARCSSRNGLDAARIVAMFGRCLLRPPDGAEKRARVARMLGAQGRGGGGAAAGEPPSAVQLVRARSFDQLAMLLTSGEIDPNAADEKQQTALHVLCTSTSASLASSGAAGETRTKLQSTMSMESFGDPSAMQRAASQANLLIDPAEYDTQTLRAMTLVLNAPGVDVNKPDTSGLTPLAIALCKRNFRAADMLLREGASVTLANTSGSGKGTTPLHYACGAPPTRSGNVAKGNREEKAEAKEYLKMMCLLFERGANMASRNALGETPLHYTAMKKNPLAAVMLLVASNERASVRVHRIDMSASGGVGAGGAAAADDIQDVEQSRGLTALDIAVQMGNTTMTSVLLAGRCGAHVLEKRETFTALCAAVRVLADADADAAKSVKAPEDAPPLVAHVFRAPATSRLAVASVLCRSAAAAALKTWATATPGDAKLPKQCADRKLDDDFALFHRLAKLVKRVRDKRARVLKSKGGTQKQFIERVSDDDIVTFLIAHANAIFPSAMSMRLTEARSLTIGKRLHHVALLPVRQALALRGHSLSVYDELFDEMSDRLADLLEASLKYDISNDTPEAREQALAHVVASNRSIASLDIAELDKHLAAGKAKSSASNVAEDVVLHYHATLPITNERAEHALFMQPFIASAPSPHVAAAEPLVWIVDNTPAVALWGYANATLVRTADAGSSMSSANSGATLAVPGSAAALTASRSNESTGSRTPRTPRDNAPPAETLAPCIGAPVQLLHVELTSLAPKGTMPLVWPPSAVVSTPGHLWLATPTAVWVIAAVRTHDGLLVRVVSVQSNDEESGASLSASAPSSRRAGKDKRDKDKEKRHKKDKDKNSGKDKDKDGKRHKKDEHQDPVFTESMLGVSAGAAVSATKVVKDRDLALPTWRLECVRRISLPSMGAGDAKHERAALLRSGGGVAVAGADPAGDAATGSAVPQPMSKSSAATSDHRTYSLASINVDNVTHDPARCMLWLPPSAAANGAAQGAGVGGCVWLSTKIVPRILVLPVGVDGAFDERVAREPLELRAPFDERVDAMTLISGAGPLASGERLPTIVAVAASGASHRVHLVAANTLQALMTFEAHRSLASVTCMRLQPLTLAGLRQAERLGTLGAPGALPPSTPMSPRVNNAGVGEDTVQPSTLWVGCNDGSLIFYSLTTELLAHVAKTAASCVADAAVAGTDSERKAKKEKKKEKKDTGVGGGATGLASLEQTAESLALAKACTKISGSFAHEGAVQLSGTVMFRPPAPTAADVADAGSSSSSSLVALPLMISTSSSAAVVRVHTLPASTSGMAASPTPKVAVSSLRDPVHPCGVRAALLVRRTPTNIAVPVVDRDDTTMVATDFEPSMQLTSSLFDLWTIGASGRTLPSGLHHPAGPIGVGGDVLGVATLGGLEALMPLPKKGTAAASSLVAPATAAVAAAAVNTGIASHSLTRELTRRAASKRGRDMSGDSKPSSKLSGASSSADVAAKDNDDAAAAAAAAAASAVATSPRTTPAKRPSPAEMQRLAAEQAEKEKRERAAAGGDKKSKKKKKKKHKKHRDDSNSDSDDSDASLDRGDIAAMLDAMSDDDDDSDAGGGGGGSGVDSDLGDDDIADALGSLDSDDD